MGDVKDIINSYISYFIQFMQSPSGLIVVLVLVLICLILFFLYTVARSRAKRIRLVSSFQKKLVESIKFNRSMEININDLLGKFADIIIAQGYYFYTFSVKEDRFILTNIRLNNNNDGDIAPSYSGLAPYKKEIYNAPQVLEISSVPKVVCIHKEGDVPVLAIPIKGGKGLILIGPVSRYLKLDKTKKTIYNSTSENMQSLLEMLIENAELKSRVGIIESQSKAVANVQHSFMDYNQMLNSITSISIKTTGADGGFLLKKEKNGSFSVPILIGFDDDRRETVRVELSKASDLEVGMGNDEYFIAKKGDENYKYIPKILKETGMGTFLITDVSNKQFQGFMGIWYVGSVELEEYRVAAVLMMTRKIGDVLQNYMIYKEMSNSYITILKMIAQTLDNVTPNTVGRSDMMYRYAYIVANALGLSEVEVQDIALAAYLSNIGVVGLSGDLFMKTGKYSDAEFELMKHHCEVGASIIEATIGNSNIALYIKDHHERMDGFGYPSRLKGEEISIGGKIIAVVQFFTAKLVGRDGRDPLSFNKALEHLKSAGGTQIDAHIVDVLCNWFEKKRKTPSIQGKTLGPCWEMRCTPLNICSTCSVYGKKEKNCFEYPKNNCEAHGNNCESCFVRTECQDR